MEGDKPPIFILVERGGREDYVPSSDVEAETALKVIGRAWGVLGGLLAWAAPMPAVPPRPPPGAPPAPTPGTITNITAFTDINITGPAEPEEIERAVERGLMRGMEARR